MAIVCGSATAGPPLGLPVSSPTGFFSLRVPGRLGSAQRESSYRVGGGSGDGPNTRNRKHHRKRTANDELSFYIGNYMQFPRQGPFERVLFRDAARSPDVPSGGAASPASAAFRFCRAAIDSVRVQRLLLLRAGLSRKASLSALRTACVKTVRPASRLPK